MPMIEREAILDERYTKRKEMREAWNVKRRLKAEQRSKDKKERKESKDVKKDTNKDSTGFSFILILFLIDFLD